MAELIVKVARLQDELLAEDVLVYAKVPCARPLFADGRDAVGVDGSLIAALLKLGVEAGKLRRERRLLHPGSKAGPQARAAKPAQARTHRHVSESDARRARNAVEMVLFNRAPQRVEDAIFDVALKLERVLKVWPIDLFVFKHSRIDEATAFILIAKSEERGNAMRKGVVRLIVELVAVGNSVFLRGEERRASSGAVAIGPANRNGVAVVRGVAHAVKLARDRLRDRRKLSHLLTLAHNAVAGEV